MQNKNDIIKEMKELLKNQTQTEADLVKYSEKHGFVESEYVSQVLAILSKATTNLTFSQ